MNSVAESKTQLPKCNVKFGDNSYYDPNGLSGVGGTLGGFLGLVINTPLAILFLIIYLFTQSTAVLVFFFLFLFGAVYSGYKMLSSLPSETEVKNTPGSRPCVDESGKVIR